MCWLFHRYTKWCDPYMFKFVSEDGIPYYTLVQTKVCTVCNIKKWRKCE
jgi:hypothetical protein